MMRTIDFMKNTHSTRPIMIRIILIAECFYKERNNPPFKDSPFWPYFRNRKRTLFHAVPEQFQCRRIFLGLTSRCCRHGEQNRIQHGGLLGEDFFAGKVLIFWEGVTEIDISQEIFTFEDGGVIEGLLTGHRVPGRDIEKGHFCPQAVFEGIVG